MHSLRDRLTVSGVTDFGVHLPRLIRGSYYEGCRPTTERARPRKREDFLAPMHEAFRDDPETNPEAVAWAVFTVPRCYASVDEAAGVTPIMPGTSAPSGPKPSCVATTN